VANGRFFFQQKTSRGAFGEAGFGDSGRLAWIEGWSLEETKEGGFRLKAASNGHAVDLLLQPEKPFAIQGANGISQKADGAGHASCYYSSTRLQTKGTLTSGQTSAAVTGESWFDHEWATNGLTPEQIGWNWFSIQLDDGTDLMLYQMRTRNGGIDPNSSGTFVAKNGQCVYLARGDYTLTPGSLWKSRRTGAEYPISWKLEIPNLKLHLEITTPVPDQELALGAIAYWEGLIKTQGTEKGAPVAGHGYMELTGYATPLTQMISAPE
jgi:predicted secreted hydrolase